MGARLLQCGATPSAMFDPSVLSKNGAWERHLASWPGVPWYLYRQGQWHETLKSGAGRGLLFHFQAPFWSDIASVFPLVVLVSRLAALWRLRVRGECRRGPTGYCVVMLISSDWVSPTRPAAWARMPRLLGSLFDRTRRTRPRGRARVPGCLEHGTAKHTHAIPQSRHRAHDFSYVLTLLF